VLLVWKVSTGIAGWMFSDSIAVLISMTERIG
jgi:hypothetical protein